MQRFADRNVVTVNSRLLVAYRHQKMASSFFAVISKDVSSQPNLTDFRLILKNVRPLVNSLILLSRAST